MVMGYYDWYQLYDLDTSTSEASYGLEAYYDDLREKEIGGVYDPFGAPADTEPVEGGGYLPHSGIYVA